MSDKYKTQCGHVAIVGRPNVGKSTLLNRILGQKLSITSRRPQTTRHQILGVKTSGDTQIVYVDTPGIHKEIPKAINRYMNRSANNSLQGIDAVVFVVDRQRWQTNDDVVLNRLKKVQCPVILAINKMDRLNDKSDLLPFLDSIKQRFEFHEIIPLSAHTGMNVDILEKSIHTLMPEGAHHFEEDDITNRSSRFFAAEFVREKIMRQLGDELPYESTVAIEEFYSENGILHISTLVMVERASQKKIIIGDQGQRLKLIGRDARLEMEKFFESKVMLNIWVKVKSGWSDDERALRSLGYDDT